MFPGALAATRNRPPWALPLGDPDKGEYLMLPSTIICPGFKHKNKDFTDVVLQFGFSFCFL